jgi:hypothetical protein
MRSVCWTLIVIIIVALIMLLLSVSVHDTAINQIFIVTCLSEGVLLKSL